MTALWCPALITAAELTLTLTLASPAKGEGEFGHLNNPANFKVRHYKRTLRKFGTGFPMLGFEKRLLPLCGLCVRRELSYYQIFRDRPSDL